MQMPPNPYDCFTDEAWRGLLSVDCSRPQVCSGNDLCVLIVATADAVGIQDSKLSDPLERRARTLMFSREELAAFVADAKAGVYDGLF